MFKTLNHVIKKFVLKNKTNKILFKTMVLNNKNIFNLGIYIFHSKFINIILRVSRSNSDAAILIIIRH